MQIVFCERCGKRISPSDLESGRCKRDDLLAWCPPCSQAMGLASKPAVAQVVAAPVAQAPQGVAQVSSAQAQTMARRPSGGRPSMMAPPPEEVMQGRRPTTGAQTRPSTSSNRVLSNSATATMPSVRKPAPKATTVRRATPSSGPSSVSAREKGGEPPPARDLTMIYIGAGAAFLIVGVLASMMLLKKDAPPPVQNTAITEKKTEPEPAKNPWQPEKTVERTGPVSTKTPPKRDTNEIPVIRPTDTTTVKMPEPVKPPPKSDEGTVPDDVPKALVDVPAKAPEIDGVLDDACWAAAKEYTLEFIEGKVGRPAGKSTVKFVATEKTFYLAAHFEESEMASVPMPIKAKDSDAWADDCIEVFLLPGKDATKDYYQWIVSVSNSIWDGMKVGNITNPGQWDAEGIVHKIKIGKDAWDVEVAIPFASIPGAAGNPYMRFNVTRNRPKVEGLTRPEEYSSWSILRRASTHTPARFGLLSFKALGGKQP